MRGEHIRVAFEDQSATKSKPGYSNRLAFVFHRIAHEHLHTIRGTELVQQRHALFHGSAVAAAEVAPKVLVVLVRAARFDLLI